MPRSKSSSGKVKDVCEVSLREEVKEALRAVLSDASAPAAAKASAGRTLLEQFPDENVPGGRRRAAEMTADEIDAEIERLQRAKQ